MKGFTLVELLVTISIFAALTGVVLVSQAKFNGSILLTNLSYETALTIREAQTYGINIKNFSVGSESNFVPYGTYFDLNYPTSFILFADINEIGDFVSSDLTACDVEEGCVKRNLIRRGNQIEALCRFVPAGQDFTEKCDLEKLTILFERPNPDAVISGVTDGGQSITGISKVSIKLGNPSQEATREVIVQSNGLIYIKPR